MKRSFYKLHTAYNKTEKTMGKPENLASYRIRTNDVQSRRREPSRYSQMEQLQHHQRTTMYIATLLETARPMRETRSPCPPPLPLSARSHNLFPTDVPCPQRNFLLDIWRPISLNSAVFIPSQTLATVRLASSSMERGFSPSSGNRFRLRKRCSAS